jgi:hypothetical protein
METKAACEAITKAIGAKKTVSITMLNRRLKRMDIPGFPSSVIFRGDFKIALMGLEVLSPLWIAAFSRVFLAKQAARKPKKQQKKGGKSDEEEELEEEDGDMMEED